MSQQRGWLLLFVAASASGVALSVKISSGRPILATRWWLLWELAAWSVAWLVGVVAAFHLPARLAIAAVIAVGVLLRLGALAGAPTTSDDLYRYSWDGRVQAAGLDPYAYAPDSPRLTSLREPWLWPGPAGCTTLYRPAGCTRINRPDQRTIYPPVAEAWFAGVYRLAGIGARSKAWQVAGLITELGVLALLPATLRRWGRDRRWAALYALSPAPVLEVVNNGHVDGLAVLFAIGALAVLGGTAHRRPVRRDVLAGVLIGAAALVKLYPGILIIAVAGTFAGTVAGTFAGTVRGTFTGASAGIGDRRWVSLARAAAAAAALAVLAYLPHLLRVGVRVLGYLPGYLSEEHYTSGGRFLLASAAHLPPGWAGAAAGTAVGAACAWVWWRRPEPPVGAAVVLGAVLLAATPVQPWYAVCLLAVATVAARPAWAAVVIAGYPYFFAVILADRHAAAIGEISYGVAALACAVRAIIASRRPPPVSRQLVTQSRVEDQCAISA